VGGIVQLEAVTKVYPPHIVALSHVNLHVERGEFVFLIGPSGAGKSTLMRLLYREERATSGRVMVLGMDLTRMRPRQVPFLRRRLGVVFQDFKLLPHKNVWQNVAFPLIVGEYSPREIRRRVPQILEVVGLADKGDAMPAELSGGEQQRVALARALVANPSLLLADEPSGNLDPATARGIAQLLQEVNQRGTTVIVATHSAAMVNALHRRVVALERGQVVRDQYRGQYYPPVEQLPLADHRLVAGGRPSAYLALQERQLGTGGAVAH